MKRGMRKPKIFSPKFQENDQVWWKSVDWIKCSVCRLTKVLSLKVGYNDQSQNEFPNLTVKVYNNENSSFENKTKIFPIISKWNPVHRKILD